MLQGRELLERLELTQKAFLALVSSAPAVLCTEAATMQLQQVALFLRRAAGADGALFSAIAMRCPAVFAMEVAPRQAIAALALHPNPSSLCTAVVHAARARLLDLCLEACGSGSSSCISMHGQSWRRVWPLPTGARPAGEPRLPAKVAGPGAGPGACAAQSASRPAAGRRGACLPAPLRSPPA